MRRLEGWGFRRGEAVRRAVVVCVEDVVVLDCLGEVVLARLRAADVCSDIGEPVYWKYAYQKSIVSDQVNSKTHAKRTELRGKSSG